MAAKLEPTRTPGVYKRGGRYAVIYRDADARQRQRSARTYDEARRLKAKLVDAVATGEHNVLSRVPLRDYALEWVDRYQGRGSRGFREATRDDYRRDLQRYILPFLHGRLRRTIEQVSPRDVANLVAWLCDEQEQGRRVAEERRARDDKAGRMPGAQVAADEIEPLYLADATVRRILSPLRACMATAMAEGLIRSNPTAGAALPARDEQRAIEQGVDLEDDAEHAKALTTEQLAAVLVVCPPKWQPFFTLLAATGLRWSEIAALRWADLQLDGSAPNVAVRRAYVRGRFTAPKSRHSRRRVPIDHELVSVLRARRRDTDWPLDEHLVFPTLTGGPLDYSNTRRRVLEPLAQEADVAWMGFHTLRHTAATRLFAEGRNAVQVQRWLGHHSPAFTLATYVHLLDNDLGDALPSAVATTEHVAQTATAALAAA